MAQVAKIDHMSLLSAEEEYGVVMRLTRVAHVSGIDVSAITQDDENGYDVLNDALTDAGVPVYGNSLEKYPELILTKRTPKMIDRDKVEIELVYEHFLNEGQYLVRSSYKDKSVYGESSASLNQIESAFDKDNEQISVKHTFPSDDPDYKNQEITQFGTVQVMIPAETFTIRGIIDDTAYSIKDLIFGKVNSGPWRGKEPRTWLCTAVNGFPLSRVDEVKTKITIEFQYNPDTWDPLVTFIDDRTGKPPKDLVENVGYKKIEYYEETNFESALRLTIESD